MKHLFTLLLFTLFISNLLSQTSFTAVYNLAGSGNDVTSFSYNGTTFTGVNPSSLLKVGITSSSSNNNFRGSNWPLGSIDPDKYIQFSILPVTNYNFTIESITFGIGRSGTGPVSWEWRGNHDSYNAPINNYSVLNVGLTNNGGTLTNPDANSSWTGNVLDVTTLYEDLTAEAILRLYGFNAEATAGTGGLQGNITITGTFSSTLPVTFSKFSATSSKNTSIVSFATASETNNAFFTIERSADGTSFDALGEIKGAGNSNTTLSYEFTDEKPFAGVNYYRIKQTDYDGKFSYSDIKSVRHNTFGNLSITPRTTEGRLQITTDAEDYTLDVYNVAGQQVKSYQSLSLDQSISIDELTAGLYYIKVNVDGQVETTKIVKL